MPWEGWEAGPPLSALQAAREVGGGSPASLARSGSVASVSLRAPLPPVLSKLRNQTSRGNGSLAARSTPGLLWGHARGDRGEPLTEPQNLPASLGGDPACPGVLPPTLALRPPPGWRTRVGGDTPSWRQGWEQAPGMKLCLAGVRSPHRSPTISSGSPGHPGVIGKNRCLCVF